MKIFAMESMIRQYKIDGLPYDVDLCFPVHKLIVEVDEDGHVYYDEEDHQIRQKLKEKLGFTITRINPDVQNFDLDVAIARICNYIKESSVKLNLAQNLAVNFAEKSLRETFPKRITELHVKHFKPLKQIKHFIKKSTTSNIKITDKKYMKNIGEKLILTA